MKQVVSLLRRDIINVLRYFKKYGISRDPDYIVDVFLSEYVPQNLRNYGEEVSQSFDEV
jgi:serine/threonine-protein kinase RIO1